MRKFLLTVLCLCLVLTGIPRAQAYKLGEPCHIRLDGLIENEYRRGYVEMMLDYYLREDTMVKMALEKGGSAVFLFDGASDNMDHPDLSDLTYYRVSAVCVVIRLDPAGEPILVYFNDGGSTLPDRPTDIGLWHFDDVGDVGPATVCDGSYELYSVRHGGAYEALHVRTDYSDKKVSAVYMTPEGYVNKRATEINIHTRTGNHVLKYQMWSAGCMLVGDGDWGQFTELMESTYYGSYDFFETDLYVGSLTLNRQLLREAMYDLYENEDAVDMIMAQTRQTEPGTYLRSCSRTEDYLDPVMLCIRGSVPVMSLPCSNSTDARSVTLRQVTRGQELKATGIVYNTQARNWYEVDLDGETGYVYTGYAEPSSWHNWLTRVFAKK